MPRYNAVELLQQHQTLVSQAIARQIICTVPRYRAIEEVQLATNVSAVVEGVICLLHRRDSRSVSQVIDLLVALHSERGFSPADYVVAVLCALPVLRRFFFHFSPNREVGIELYEQVEAILLPLYGHLVMRLSAGFEDEEDTETAVTEPLDRDELDYEGGALPFEIVTVEQVLELKAEQSQIRRERDRLAEELDQLRQVVDHGRVGSARFARRET